MHSFLHFQYPQSEQYVVTNDERMLIHHNHLKSRAYIAVHSWCLHSMGLGQCIMTSIHRNSIIQSIFSALKTSVLFLFIFPSSLNPWQPHFTISKGLHFSRMSYSWDQSDRLLLFSNVNLRSLSCIFMARHLISFQGLIILQCLDVQQFIYLLIC